MKQTARIHQKQNYYTNEFRVDYTFRLGLRTRRDRGKRDGGRLAKEAAVKDGPTVYDKIPKDVIVTREKEDGLQRHETLVSNYCIYKFL
jgi:hypothetical protein